MSALVHLKIAETCGVDTARINEIYGLYGSIEAQSKLDDVIDQAHAHMAQIEHGITTRGYLHVFMEARMLQELADDAGLIGLSRVAKDTQICAQSLDFTALNAVICRMSRILGQAETALFHAC
jgi:hypothetical protein